MADISFTQPGSPTRPKPQRQALQFEVVVKRVEKPFSGRSMDGLDWICQSLGFLEPIDRKRTASAVFKEILRATEEGRRISSSGLAERVGMSRGSVVNHLNNLMRSGLIVRNGRFYSARSRSVYRTLEEIEADIQHVFSKMKGAALVIDRELGVPTEKEQ